VHIGQGNDTDKLFGLNHRKASDTFRVKEPTHGSDGNIRTNYNWVSRHPSFYEHSRATASPSLAFWLYSGPLINNGTAMQVYNVLVVVLTRPSSQNQTANADQQQ
jgi:hypothetical protein